MVNGEAVKFNYPAFLADNYRCRVTVENHNTLRHGGGTKYQIGL